MIDIPQMEITIKGKKYNVLRPSAMQIIEAEDNYVDDNGQHNLYEYQKSMLKFVDRKLKPEDVVENKGTIIGSFDLSPITYKQFCDLMPKTRKPNRAKVVGAVVKMLSTGEGAVDPHTLEMDFINEMYISIMELYDFSEVTKVVDDIYKFCVPGYGDEDGETDV